MSLQSVCMCVWSSCPGEIWSEDHKALLTSPLKMIVNMDRNMYGQPY